VDIKGLGHQLFAFVDGQSGGVTEEYPEFNGSSNSFPLAKPGRPADRSDRYKVLIVEDSPPRLAAFQRIFDGQHLSTTSFAEEAQQMLQDVHEYHESPFDFVLLDYALDQHDSAFHRKEHGCGMDVVRWLVSAPGYGADVRRFCVHSGNDEWHGAMVRELYVAGFPVISWPFVWCHDPAEQVLAVLLSGEDPSDPDTTDW